MDRKQFYQEILVPACVDQQAKGHTCRPQIVLGLLQEKVPTAEAGDAEVCIYSDAFRRHWDRLPDVPKEEVNGHFFVAPAAKYGHRCVWCYANIHEAKTEVCPGHLEFEVL